VSLGSGCVAGVMITAAMYEQQVMHRSLWAITTQGQQSRALEKQRHTAGWETLMHRMGEQRRDRR
jgi:hypothetical protein